jgi:predicted HicB family RNase H-like nuclease
MEAQIFMHPIFSGLHKEGQLSLNMFLEMCSEDEVSPRKNYSGKFNVRISPKLHENLVLKASATGNSINQLVIESISSTVVNGL